MIAISSYNNKVIIINDYKFQSSNSIFDQY